MVVSCTYIVVHCCMILFLFILHLILIMLMNSVSTTIQIIQPTILSYFYFYFYSARTYVYSMLTMDDENHSSNLFFLTNFSIFITSMVSNNIQEPLNGQEHYNTTYKFNTSCTKEIQCENTAMFCNLTTLLCQCAVFHFWNETVGICEFQHEHLSKWLDENRTNNVNFITEIVQDPLVSRYNIPMPIIVVMILGGICFLFCAAYVCYGTDEVDRDKKSVSAALCKQQEQSCRIQTSILDNF